MRKNDYEKNMRENSSNLNKISNILYNFFIKYEPKLGDIKKEFEKEIFSAKTKSSKKEKELRNSILSKVNSALKKLTELRTLFFLQISELERFLNKSQIEYLRKGNLHISKNFKDKWKDKEFETLIFFAKKEKDDENKNIDKSNFYVKIFDQLLFDSSAKTGYFNYLNEILDLKKIEDESMKLEMAIKVEFTKFLIYLAPNFYRNYDFSFFPNCDRKFTEKKSFVQFLISVNNIRNKYLKVCLNKSFLTSENVKTFFSEKSNLGWTNFSFNAKYNNKMKIVKTDGNYFFSKFFKKDLKNMIEAIVIWTKEDNKNILINKIISISEAIKKINEKIELKDNENETNKYILNDKSIKNFKELSPKKIDNKIVNITNWNRILNSNFVSDKIFRKKKTLYNNFSKEVANIARNHFSKIDNIDSKNSTWKEKYKTLLLASPKTRKILCEQRDGESFRKVKSFANFNDSLTFALYRQWDFLEKLIQEIKDNQLEKEINFFENIEKIMCKIRNLRRHFNESIWEDKMIDKQILKIFFEIYNEYSKQKENEENKQESQCNENNKKINTLITKNTFKRVKEISETYKNIEEMEKNVYKIFLHCLIIITIYNLIIKLEINEEKSFEIKEKIKYFKGISISYKNSFIGLKKLNSGMLFSIMKRILKNLDKRYPLFEDDLNFLIELRSEINVLKLEREIIFKTNNKKDIKILN